MESVIALLVAVVAIIVIRLPTRMLGKHLHAAGVREQSRWKRDLGAAIHAHSLRLTIAVVGLFTILLPQLIFGTSLLDM